MAIQALAEGLAIPTHETERKQDSPVCISQVSCVPIFYLETWKMTPGLLCVKKALCDMGQEPGSYEGGWTLVLWHSTQSSDDLQLNLSSYTEGYGQPNINAPKSYFIGDVDSQVNAFTEHSHNLQQEHIPYRQHETKPTYQPWFGFLYREAADVAKYMAWIKYKRHPTIYNRNLYRTIVSLRLVRLSKLSVYSIGLQYLAALNWNSNTVRPLVMKALCDMGQEPGSYEGGWTLVLWHSTQSSDDLQLNLSSYTVGYGQPNINAPKSYFIGLQYLAALNWNSNTVRPLVMKIVMVNQSSTLHATYGNLVINKNDGKYTLNSLGDYQGNSGDYLTGSVGRAFCAYGSSPDFCWWGNPGDTSNNLLTGDRPQWGNSDLTSVMVWVRSQTCDDALACPPMNTFNLPDESVVPLSRAPNTTFPYNCVGDLMMARKVDGTKSPAGQVTCVPASNGSPLKWDTVFPCVLVCPSNFVLSYNGTSCYYFSTTRASMGHTDALTRCAAMNATLAFITDPRDMQTANNSIYYLTAFTIRRNGAIFPDIGSFQAHGFDCDLKYLYCPGQRNGEDLCIILNNGGHLNLTNCYNNMYYACMRPGMCPPGYTLYRSRCYKVITKNQFSNFLDALDTCNYDGAALAYPQDTDFLNYLVKFAQSHITWSSPTTNNIAIGFNNIWDNLTINNIYAPSTDVINAVKSLTRSTTSNCTFLNVSKNSDQWVLTPTSINTTFTYAICEFRGPQELDEFPMPFDKNIVIELSYVWLIASLSFKGNITLKGRKWLWKIRCLRC
nr:uncharacterized protein LOC128685266 [Cherax quadricarinatus]